MSCLCKPHHQPMICYCYLLGYLAPKVPLYQFGLNKPVEIQPGFMGLCTLSFCLLWYYVLIIMMTGIPHFEFDEVHEAPRSRGAEVTRMMF